MRVCLHFYALRSLPLSRSPALTSNSYSFTCVCVCVLLLYAALHVIEIRSYMDCMLGEINRFTWFYRYVRVVHLR